MLRFFWESGASPAVEGMQEVALWIGRSVERQFEGWDEENRHREDIDEEHDAYVWEAGHFETMANLTARHVVKANKETGPTWVLWHTMKAAEQLETPEQLAELADTIREMVKL